MKSLLILFLELFLLKRKTSDSILREIEVDAAQPVEFPLQNSGLHQGFVNSLNNKNGMQAIFFVEGPTTVSCKWENTDARFQGFSGIIHGGVLVALADELMANCLVGLKKQFGVTLTTRVQWKAPVKVGDVVKGRAFIRASFKNFCLLQFVLVALSGKEVLTGSGVFYLPTMKQLKKMTGLDLPNELQSYVRK